MRRHVVAGALAVLLAASASAETEPAKILSGAKEPQLAVSPSGGIYVVAARDGVISISTSSDGKSFGTPIEVGKVEKLELGMRRGPRIAVTEKAVVVTAIGSWQGTEGELLAFSSATGGATWSAPVRVNTAAGSAREGLHALAAGPKDEVVCTWLDLRQKATELYACVSTDGGATWQKDSLAYHSPSGTVCECCHPSAAFTTKGEIALMFRNLIEGSRDLWVVRSKDHGKTWGGEKKLGEGSWPLKACPMDGGAISPAPDGSLTTVWRRATEVFVARPGKAERSLGDGMQPVVAEGPGGTHVAWLEKRGGELRVLVPGAKAPRALSRAAGDPALVGAPDGKGPVVLTWTEGGDVSVLVLTKRK